MSTIDPTEDFPNYPILNFPDPNDIADIDELQTFITDIHNRLLFLKNLSNSNTTKLSNAETKIGLTFANSDLPTWVVGSQDFSNKTVKEAIEILNTYISSIDVIINNFKDNIGGNVEGSTPLAYASTNEIDPGDSHHSALEKVDNGVGEAKDSIITISPTIAANEISIANIINKISDTAGDAGVGLNFTSHNFLIDGDKVDAGMSKLDKPIMAIRRITEYNFIQSLFNWRDTAFGESGGSIPNNYYYDSLYNSSKINSENSTANSYDNVDQAFGRDDSSWVYYSEVSAIPAATNRIKIKWSGMGALSFSCNFQGNYAAEFEDLPTEDSWITIPTGTQLVVKIVGGSGARLYSYKILYKEV